MLSDKIKSSDKTTLKSREETVTQDNENTEILNSVSSSAGKISEFPNFWKLIR